MGGSTPPLSSTWTRWEAPGFIARVAQVDIERTGPNREAAGSSPASRTSFAELDQRLDRLPYKQVVGGSSPSLRTKFRS